MPLEGQRTRGRKTIQLPDGERIDIPVITSISFVDPDDRFQETVYTVDNTTTAGRTVHVDQVHPTDTSGDTPSQDTETSLPVERVDEWPVLDASDRHQETRVQFDNVTGNDATPPSFSNHARTHVYRYYQDPENQDDGGVWVDSELIDEFDVIDASDRHQETRVTLRNPARDDMAGQADPGDPDITEFGEDSDPLLPVRTDPFQNIVNYSSGTYLIITFEWRDFLTTNLGERCTLTSASPTVNTFTAGVQTRVHDASYITVQLDDTDTAIFNALLNGSTDTSGQPETVTTPTNVFGYAKFPSCFVCSSTSHAIELIYPPQEAPPGQWPISPCTGAEPFVYADPVAYNDYSISFLFDISPSDEDSPTADRTEISFTISGLPSPRTAVYLERTLPVLPVGSTVGNKKFEYITQDTSRMRFQARTYDKSAVDVYLDDVKFPLRLKTLSNPTSSEAARTETKNNWKTLVDYAANGVINGGWIDVSNNVHELLTDAEFETGDEMGTFGFNTDEADVIVKLEFDKETVGPGGQNLPGNVEVKRNLAWPKEPPNTTETAVLTGSIPSGTFTTGPFDPRQYQYFWRIKDNFIENGTDPSITNFGVEPGNANTA